VSNAPDTARMPGLAALDRDQDRRAALRLEAIIRRNLDLVARVMRNLGAPPPEIEDLLQQAFSITAARLADIAPGRERAFVVETAVRLTANARRRSASSREIAMNELPDVADQRPGPDDLSDSRRALRLLDGILDEMGDDLRSVFVLHEVEEMTMAEIALTLELPPGTVASRLRRAREDFLGRARRRGLHHPGDGR
jgi:RNA polymerase sigma-70 factor, ECF subfamily